MLNNVGEASEAAVIQPHESSVTLGRKLVLIWLFFNWRTMPGVWRKFFFVANGDGVFVLIIEGGGADDA